MSVYIKSMEMPKPGQIVLVEIDENGDVFAAYDGGRTKLTQYKAVHVPGHGRLIDADALITKVTDAAIKQPEIADVYYEQASEIGGWLYSMPTIIPADKDGE